MSPGLWEKGTWNCRRGVVLGADELDDAPVSNAGRRLGRGVGEGAQGLAGDDGVALEGRRTGNAGDGAGITNRGLGRGGITGTIHRRVLLRLLQISVLAQQNVSRLEHSYRSIGPSPCQGVKIMSWMGQIGGD